MTLLALAGLLTLVGTGATIVSLVVLHLLPTGLSPLAEPVSQYGITRFRLGYAIAGFGAGLAGIATIVAIGTAGISALPSAILLAVFAVARVLIPFIPMDAPGAATTTTGRLHTVLAFAAFGSVTAAAFTAAGAFHDAGWTAIGLTSTVCGSVMALGALGLLITRRPAMRGAFGAAERVIYVGFLGWFSAIGIAVLAQ